LSAEKNRIYSEILAIRCRRRDSGALEELISLWEKRLFYYIRRLVDDEEDTWDILQETWLKVLRGIGGLREPQSLPMWLYSIARNTAMSHLRGRYADKAATDENGDPSDADGDAEAFSFEDAEQVHLGLSRLSLPHREVLTLHFLDDLSVEEIAELLEFSQGTIKSRLHYAKLALRTVIEQEESK
jgi:RNA polymerase sigma-70 factor (ECF subfamily)